MGWSIAAFEVGGESGCQIRRLFFVRPLELLMKFFADAI